MQLAQMLVGHEVSLLAAWLCAVLIVVKRANLRLQGAEQVAAQLAAEGFGRANRSSPAQLFAGFLTQTAAIVAAWQHGKRFRCHADLPEAQHTVHWHAQNAQGAEAGKALGACSPRCINTHAPGLSN
jgi:hypothetical protein